MEKSGLRAMSQACESRHCRRNDQLATFISYAHFFSGHIISLDFSPKLRLSIYSPGTVAQSVERWSVFQRSQSGASLLPTVLKWVQTPRETIFYLIMPREWGKNPSSTFCNRRYKPAAWEVAKKNQYIASIHILDSNLRSISFTLLNMLTSCPKVQRH